MKQRMRKEVHDIEQHIEQLGAHAAICEEEGHGVVTAQNDVAMFERGV